MKRPPWHGRQIPSPPHPPHFPWPCSEMAQMVEKTRCLRSARVGMPVAALMKGVPCMRNTSPVLSGIRIRRRAQEGHPPCAVCTTFVVTPCWTVSRRERAGR